MKSLEKVNTGSKLAETTESLGVSIQGFEGSFHQMAAREYFGQDVKVIPCSTFREVVKIAANRKESMGGVMAIENSIAGSILPNYTLLQKSSLIITGACWMLMIKQLLKFVC